MKLKYNIYIACIIQLIEKEDIFKYTQSKQSFIDR
jgi:hypothetical protein